MQKDIYARAVLTLIALFLAVLAWEQWTSPAHMVPVNAASASRQGWEYKRIQIDLYELKNGKTADSTKWSEDGKEQDTPYDLSKRMNELGTQGWELVTVAPSSDFYPRGLSISLGKVAFTDSFQGTVYGELLNGLTTTKVYYFKRPRA